MIGDVLKRELSLLLNTSKNKNAKNAFWRLIRDIAVQDIKEFAKPIDSQTLIDCYYKILNSNLSYIPSYFQETLKSNKQKRYRVILRNIFTSNANHKDGLIHQKGIEYKTEHNLVRAGKKIIYKWNEKFNNTGKGE
ncbi:Uncharacterised protein [Mycoplasmopsis californica]|uniref:Uncharacterized protein n=1 Tax=Mycoplasmopsis equigenitalium TaxID=114883 RepID=A0ABY5J2W2_9BACT|nr:hypothetical protein [Mycoplasmopsis equigenitalium]UUD37113.1 hypothetical protein NPA09_00860 [Mycoplasmopsis equigenitalium]VEU69583.1 Uncharacterised protein [Mycoplasmopsis californica]